MRSAIVSMMRRRSGPRGTGTCHAAEAAADSRVKVRRIVHTIHAVADIAACRARYLDMLGGLIFAEGYFEAEDRDMALLYVADHMIEPMAPRDPARLDKHFARYLHRYGPGLHSLDFSIGPERSRWLESLRAARCDALRAATEFVPI
jgi:hypothetical protein